MCDAKPGTRCANDTRRVATSTLEGYRAEHPDGPEVGTLESAAAAMAPVQVAAVDQVTKRLDDAVADRDAKRETFEALHARSTALAADATHAFDGAQATARAAGVALERGLDRVRVHYRAEGARFADYYIKDMREAAGLPLSGLPVSDIGYGAEQYTHSLAASKTPYVKVKRTGQDAAATARAAAAAKADPVIAAAFAEYKTGRQATVTALERYRMLDRQAQEAQRTTSAAACALEAANAQVTAAEHAVARARTGVHPDATPARVGGLSARDITVNADGTTNIWVTETAPDGKVTYERVARIEQRRVGMGGEGPVMVTQSGRTVVSSTHYANYTSTRHDPQVFVEPPAAGSRTAAEAHPGLVLHSVIDSGG